MNRLLILPALLFFSSCAAIFNKRTYNVQIQSYNTFTSIKYKDSTYALPADLQITRSPKPIQIVAARRGFQQDITVRPRPHARFLYGNMLFLYFAPVGYIVDFTNPNRFDFGKTVILDNVDSTGILRPGISKKWHTYWSHKYPYCKRETFAAVFLPVVNSFHMRPFPGQIRRKTGFMGIGGELQYAYRDNRSLGMETSLRLVQADPFVANDQDKADTIIQHSAFHVSLSHNHKIGRLLVGYGLHFTGMRIRTMFGDTNNYREVKQKWSSIGPMVRVGFQAGRLVYVGANYSPSLYTMSPTSRLEYQHILSFDVALQLRLRKGKISR